MNLSKQLTLLIFASTLMLFSFGQSNATKDSIKVANRYYHNGYFKKAIPVYQYILKELPDDAEINFRLGHSILNSPIKSEARKYLERAYSLNKKVDEDVVFELAQAFQYEHNWDKAIEFYKLSEEAGNRNIENFILQCELGKKLTSETINVTIEDMGTNINSAFAEYAAVVTSDGNSIYFTSRRPNTTGGKRDYELDVWMEDIYVSTKDEQGNWSEAKNLGKPVNSEGHDATVNISGDGQTLFIYRSENSNGGDIYVSKLEGDVWSSPISIGENVNTKHREVSAAISPDGKTLYFVSDKPGGLGGMDIYKSNRGEDGVWSEPENLGTPINTEKNEDGVFIHADGKTMYFSSNGHPTIGGYDIFKSEFTDSNWSSPENIGIPINTADNDVFFVMDAEGKEAYYSSGKIGGNGEKDLYKITFHEEEKNLALYKGVVMNEAGEKLKGQIEITIMKSGKLFHQMESNIKSGEFTLTLPNGEDYEILVAYKDLIPFKGEILLKDKQGYQEFSQDIVLMEGNKNEELDYVYTIQLATRIEKSTAEAIKNKLITSDVFKDVYVQKVVFTDTEQTLYRVRFGRFDTLEEGEAVGNKIPIELLPDGHFWVDNVREENYFVDKHQYDILEE